MDHWQNMTAAARLYRLGVNRDAKISGNRHEIAAALKMDEAVATLDGGIVEFSSAVALTADSPPSLHAQARARQFKRTVGYHARMLGVPAATAIACALSAVAEDILSAACVSVRQGPALSSSRLRVVPCASESATVQAGYLKA